jgi:mono/diheme cytochrome c family protein
MRNNNLALIGMVVGSLCIAGATAAVSARPAHAQAQMSYSEDIAPIFRGWCVSCHQPGGIGYEASGFDLTTYQGLMKGTKFGPVVIPSKPNESSLMVVLSEGASPEMRMPAGHKPLPSGLRREIWRWIFQGAEDN